METRSHPAVGGVVGEALREVQAQRHQLCQPRYRADSDRYWDQELNGCALAVTQGQVC